MADRASAPASPPTPDGEVSGYFRTRLAPNPHRAAVWKHLCAYLQRWASRWLGAPRAVPAGEPTVSLPPISVSRTKLGRQLRGS